MFTVSTYDYYVLKNYDKTFNLKNSAGTSTFTFKKNVVHNRLDEDNCVIYEFALPGYSKDEINVEIKSVDNKLLLGVTSKKSEDSKDKVSFFKTDEKYFYESIGKDTDLDASKVKASMKDGILTVTVPKKDEVLPKKYDVVID